MDLVYFLRKFISPEPNLFRKTYLISYSIPSMLLGVSLRSKLFQNHYFHTVEKINLAAKWCFFNLCSTKVDFVVTKNRSKGPKWALFRRLSLKNTMGTSDAPYLVEWSEIDRLKSNYVKVSSSVIEYMVLLQMVSFAAMSADLVAGLDWIIVEHLNQI